MLKINNVRKLGNRYIAQSLSIICLLTVIGIVVSLTVSLDTLCMPLSISAAFFFVLSLAEGLIWKRVAKNSPDSLSTFYTAVSGFRMLLSLFTLFVCYLVVGRDAMLEYCIVFMAYYFVLLVHHSVFFSHVSNSHTMCDKEK